MFFLWSLFLCRAHTHCGNQLIASQHLFIHSEKGQRHTVIPTFLTGAGGRERLLWLFSGQLENEEENIMAPASRMVLLMAASRRRS